MASGSTDSSLPVIPPWSVDQSASPWSLAPSSSWLHQTISSLRLCLGQLSLCQCHGLPGLWLSIVRPLLCLCRFCLASPWSHRLRLSPLAHRIHLGCSSLWSRLGLQIHRCHHVSSSPQLRLDLHLSCLHFRRLVSRFCRGVQRCLHLGNHMVFSFVPTSRANTLPPQLDLFP